MPPTLHVPLLIVGCAIRLCLNGGGEGGGSLPVQLSKQASRFLQEMNSLLPIEAQLDELEILDEVERAKVARLAREAEAERARQAEAERMRHAEGAVVVEEEGEDEEEDEDLEVDERRRHRLEVERKMREDAEEDRRRREQEGGSGRRI